MQNSLSEAWDSALGGLLERLLAHLPQLLSALLLLLVGWLLAGLLRMATRRGIALLDALIARSTRQARWRVGKSAKLMGALVYWVVLLFFVAAATQTLGLQTFTDWLARLLEQLPTLVAGLLIVVVGYLLSGFVAELVRAASTAMPQAQRNALARVAQVATLMVALLVGADQIGLKVTWIAILAMVLLGTAMGGVSIAVSLGARRYVANLIGAHYLRQTLQLGQRVRVQGHEGRIVELSATSLVLETADGRVMLPGAVFHDDAIVLLARQTGD